LLLVVSWFIVQWSKPYLVLQYGIDPDKVVVIFLIAELFFDLGLMMMLWFSGVKRLTWSIVKGLKLKEFRFDPKNIGVGIGLLVNRASWIIPFAYIIFVGLGKLPWIVICACFLEIMITIWVGLITLGIFGPVKSKIRIRSACFDDIDDLLSVRP